jgi:NAD(P)-dependent dehydrogenase (short-subunit alcohol dehydrogenase family)
LRDRISEIRELGAALVIVGNGSAAFAEAFRDEYELDGPLLVDPELRAYRAAGLRRGRVEALSPRLPLNALRALRSGARQQSVQGDPWQLGGVFVIRPGGELCYRYVSQAAGDHAPVSDVLAALAEQTEPIREQIDPPRAQRWLSRALSHAVDPSVFSSFDRTGFRIHSLGFLPSDLDVDLSGRRCLVTGANSGIGYQSALALADLGAEVVLLCRSPERGEDAAERIRSQTGNPRVTVEPVDLSDLASVRAAAARLTSEPIDVLVHNAGVLPDERVETAAGLELAFATHVVGPFLLTKLCRSRLERSADGRIVWVSSGGMYTRRLNVADPGWEQRRYDGVLAYAETKRAQVVLSELWAEELRGTSVGRHASGPQVAAALPPRHAIRPAHAGRGRGHGRVARGLAPRAARDRTLLLRPRAAADALASVDPRARRQSPRALGAVRTADPRAAAASRSRGLREAAERWRRCVAECLSARSRTRTRSGSGSRRACSASRFVSTAVTSTAASRPTSSAPSSRRCGWCATETLCGCARSLPAPTTPRR